MQTRPGTRGPRRLGAALSKATRATFRRRGFAHAGVLSRWPEIVGEELATMSCPEKLSFPPGRGDVNCDGSLDLGDVEPFIDALLDAEKYKQKYPDCDIKRADITLDGSVDLLDVEPFITLLLN